MPVECRDPIESPVVDGADESSSNVRSLDRPSGLGRVPARDVATLATLAPLLAGCPAPPPVAAPMPRLPDNLARLLSRTSFGINAEEAERALDLGYEGYLEFQLDHEAIDDGPTDQALRRFWTLNHSPIQRLRAFERGDFTSLLEFYSASLLRAARSRRQLFERMVELWSDHFNIFIEAEAQQLLKPVDDREVVRPNALGTFPDLLRASAHSPAMLFYLDNASSYAGAPNQNYARELMELHSLGVDNFTQEDVLEVARAFTGWSIQYDAARLDFGAFRFYPEVHDTVAKTVFGRRLPAGRGQEDGEEVLNLIALDPVVSQHTARFVARKLARHFWGYEPPEALLEEIAAAYRDTQGDLRAMLRVVLRESWLLQAPPKLKRPWHFATSALRARSGDIRRYEVQAELLRQMEHLPFNWAPPNGYPDSPNYWGNYLMPRWNHGVWMAFANDIFAVDWKPYVEAESDIAFLDQLDADFFQYRMPSDHRAALETFLAAAPGNGYRRLEAVSLAIASASFQWY